MRIVKKYKVGTLKGYTIRQSKYGWFSIYSSNGVCQSLGKINTIKEAVLLVNDFRKNKRFNLKTY